MIRITYLDAPAYVVDDEVLRRYPQRQTVFGRHHTDAEAPFYRRSQHDVALAKAQAQESGYTRVHAAMTSAAWTVAHHFRDAYDWQLLGKPPAMLRDLGRYEVEDCTLMSAQVKDAARMYGAVLTGIASLDQRWVYKLDHRGNPIVIPEAMTSAIVMAVPMDWPAIQASPTYDAAIATGVGYSRMAFVTSSVAQFIRALGYRAIPMANDTALSVPLAIDAGLGELGRNGLLITPDYGACVRLCKVFTDLPLTFDRPITFGLEVTCRTCRRCADACEVGAISKTDAPSFDVACASNNPGVRRWAVDFDRCYTYWMDNGTNCSTCIAACPMAQRAFT